MLSIDRRTDGRTDKVNPVYPPPLPHPTSLGGGIKIKLLKLLQSGHGIWDRRKDGRTDRWSETNIPPNNFVVRGYNNVSEELLSYHVTHLSSQRCKWPDASEGILPHRRPYPSPIVSCNMYQFPDTLHHKLAVCNMVHSFSYSCKPAELSQHSHLWWKLTVFLWCWNWIVPR